MPRTFATLDEFQAATGQHLGTSEWVKVDQDRIDLFADATGDQQWIHVDPERAVDGPYGHTIAHGYLTLSLLPAFIGSIFTITNRRVGINYGLNRVRFPSPVAVGSRVRAAATLEKTRLAPSGLEVTLALSVECKGVAKPACIAEAVYIYR